MFPLNWNIPFIRKNGSRTTLGAITGDIAGIEEDIAGVKEDVIDLTDKTDGILDNIMENGAVNSFGITKAELHSVNTDGTWSGETYTNNGATFACEYDNGGYLKKVTVNKSTGGNSMLTLKKAPKFPYLPIKLTGCPSGGASKYYIYYANWNTSDGVVYDYGDGATITSQFDYSTYPNARIAIRINSGQTVSNLVFYPMLSEPSLDLAYDDYVPYAMTNRELTEVKTTSVTAKGVTLGIVKSGNVCVSRFSGSLSENVAPDSTILTIPDGYKPISQVVFLTTNKLASLSNYVAIAYNDNGNVQPSDAGVATGDALRGSACWITES